MILSRLLAIDNVNVDHRIHAAFVEIAKFSKKERNATSKPAKSTKSAISVSTTDKLVGVGVLPGPAGLIWVERFCGI
jgi:hypothetical protein